MELEVRIIINRHPDEYNDEGYDIELRASTIYKSEVFNIVCGGYAEEVDKAKEKVIKALQSEINYILFLGKKRITVDEVIGVTVETKELDIEE